LAGVFNLSLNRELLVLGVVEEELENGRGVLEREQLLEVIDQLVARRPDRLWRQLVHACDEHVLVMRAVEDRDLALGRRMRRHAPEKVVRQLVRGRPLEPGDLAAGGVHPGDHRPKYRAGHLVSVERQRHAAAMGSDNWKKEACSAPYQAAGCSFTFYQPFRCDYGFPRNLSRVAYNEG
jgi:hypothetical protein